MTPRNIVFTRSAEREMRRLDRQTAARALAAIERLAKENVGDVRSLTGRAAHIAAFRLRVGGWRVLFDLDEEAGEMIIRRVRSRGSAYTDL